MTKQGFTLTSPNIVPDGVIPSKLTCDGENSSPQLKWLHPPEGTRSFVLILDDPDAPQGTFTHWVLFDIPGEIQELPAGANGIGIVGRNDFQQSRYGGPCPPPNHGQHRYYFKLFGLDVETLRLDAGAARSKRPCKDTSSVKRK